MRIQRNASGTPLFRFPVFIPIFHKTFSRDYKITGDDDLGSDELATESRPLDWVAADCSPILGVGDTVCFLVGSGVDMAALFRIN